MKPACHLHDRVNLVLLPIIGSLTVAGLLGYVDTTIVSAIFSVYVAVDLLWVAAIPEAVPSLPSIILVHHVVTLVLLLFPLRYPQFGRYTCWVSAGDAEQRWALCMGLGFLLRSTRAAVVYPAHSSITSSLN